jgi:hypothetical protein
MSGAAPERSRAQERELQRDATATAAPLTPAAVAEITRVLSSVQTLALTMWAEGRSRLEPRRGWVPNPVAAMADVANVVVNRARDPRWRRLTIKEVCLQRAQFSCWLPIGGADNYESLMRQAQHLLAGDEPGHALDACLDIAAACVAGTFRDRLDGATHYHATWSTPPRWTAPPARRVAERWGHRFYADVR